MVVRGGDFRQISPVIQHGTRSDVVSSCINKSEGLWNSCRFFVLTTNMRLSDQNITGAKLIQMRVLLIILLMLLHPLYSLIF